MNEITRIENVFEDQTIAAYLWEDKPVWIAKELGRAMGYSSDGERLTDLIRGQWKEEVIDGQDAELLTGEKLASFKAATPALRGSSINSLLLLKESGFHLCCIKSDKPIGVRLRRWLAEVVMPSLIRTGSYQGKPLALEDLRPSALAGLAKAAEKGQKWAVQMVLGQKSPLLGVPALLSSASYKPGYVSVLASLFSEETLSLMWKDFGNEWFRVESLRTMLRAELRFNSSLESTSNLALGRYLTNLSNTQQKIGAYSILYREDRTGTHLYQLQKGNSDAQETKDQ